MTLSSKITVALSACVGIAVASFVGYKVATDAELRGKLVRGARDTIDTTKKKFDGMTEDVALRTAQMTRNPKINQDWVARQWESVGY